MAVLKYSDILVFFEISVAPEYYFSVAATNLSITNQNQLESSRILAANQNNNFRIGGELNTKINMSFLVCNQDNTIAGGTWNLFSGIHQYLTGDIFCSILIGNEYYNSSYLENASLEITPFAPIVCNAEFTCLNPPVNGPAITPNSFVYTDALSSGIAYGYTTTITSGTTLSDSNRESISYKINCNRSYTTSIGLSQPNNAFLNSIEKEMSIKARNIGNLIDYTGYGEIININPKTLNDKDIISGGFGMSSNCRVLSQNLSVQEDGILAGDISLKEVIL